MQWEPRLYQEEAIAECLDAFVARGRTSVMLESPVGSGKTYMALRVIRALRERLGRPVRVVWAAPRRLLLEQVAEANAAFGGEDVHPVTIFEKYPPKADLLVLDEAHHEATQSCVLLYERVGASLALGLSATPLRTDRMKLSFQETVATCSVDRLVREGHLSPFRFHLLPHYDPAIVAECYLSDPARWGKSIAFFPTIRDCGDFRERLAATGVRCEVVTSESDKDRQLEAFASGAAPVVANVSMLTEGFDRPEVGTIFARDATRLPCIQMCGRGLRKAPGKAFCNIVQGSASPFLFERFAPAERSYRLHGGVWLSLTDGTEQIEAALAETLRRIGEREARVAASGGAGRARGGGRPRPARPRAAAGGAGAGQGEDSAAETYRDLYRLFDAANAAGWGRALPRCRLRVNARETPTRVVAFATPPSHAQGGAPTEPRITFNLYHCGRTPAEGLAHTLLHEMTHVWQFAHGRSGGHGPDFRREMARLGIYEEGGATNCRVGSPADRFLRFVAAGFAGIPGRLLLLRDLSPAARRRVEDAAFLARSV